VYLANCTGLDEPANAEAGPSNFVPQHTPYMAQPPTNTSGEPPEATANAANQKQLQKKMWHQ
jgi:hypothetical protein